MKHLIALTLALAISPISSAQTVCVKTLDCPGCTPPVSYDQPRSGLTNGIKKFNCHMIAARQFPNANIIAVEMTPDTPSQCVVAIDLDDQNLARCEELQPQQ